MSNTPKIRFREYFENWEKIKFGNIYAIASGFAFKKDDYVKKGVLLVNGESIQHGTISSGNWNYLPSEFLNKYKAFLLKTDDIVLGLNRPITNKKLKIAKVSNELNNSLLYQRAGRVEFKTDISKEFSYQIIENEVYKFVKKEAVGSDQPFISTQKLAKWSFFYTGNTKEQIKIGLFFKQLDETIILQQQLLNDHIQFKKVMLQKMFPQKGETIPKVRFAEFTGNWNQKKLGEIYETSLNKNKNLKYGKENIISVSKMKFKDNSSTSSDKYMKTYNVLKKNEIAFEGNKSKDYKYGRFVLNDIGDGIVSHVFIVMKPKIEISTFFIKEYINNENIMRNILLFSTTSTLMMTSLNSREFLKQKLRLPAFDEQVKIGDFFNHLDETISLHQKKLETYQELKKAMLQKMFV